MSNADTLELAIATVLDGNAGLAGVKRFYLGMPYRVPTQDWPYVMVLVDTEESMSQMTGNRAIRSYSGAVVINVMHQDISQGVAGRIVQVPSYGILRGYMDAAIRALKSDSGQVLDGAAIANGVIRGVIIGEEVITYGVAAESERADSLMNYGIIPFVVETVEAF